MMALEHLVANTNQKGSRIGWLLWYRIADEQTDKAVADAAFMLSALPQKYRMPDIRPVDAYRRATKSIEGRIDGLNREDKIECLVRDVYHTKNEVVRHLVVERCHASGRRLDYDQCAAMLMFNHTIRTIDVELNNPEGFVADAVRKFEANYRRYLTSYDGNAKRRTVRAVLDDLAATSLKESGGVYLIPRQHEELLFQLIAYVGGLNGCKAYKMPVEDTAETRDMVRDVVTNKAQTMLSEIRAALRGGMVPEKMVQQLLEQSRQVKREVTLYQDILKESMGTLETDVELLEAQMVNLLGQL